MKISSSIDWNKASDELRRNTRKIGTYENKFQVLQLIRNIDSKVAELSKSEVIDRRGRSNMSVALLNDVNNDIELVEEYILIATLIG